MQAPLQLENKRFGKLQVIKRVDNIGRKSAWLCVCDCGKEQIIAGSSLVAKKGTKSCGCLKKTHFIDLEGTKVDDVNILKVIGKNKHNCWIYECQCNCGNKFVAEGNDITSRKIKSCGCKLNSKQIQKMQKNELNGFVNKVKASYKNRAKTRKLEFSLTTEEFKNLIFSKCEYCGISPANTALDARKHSSSNYIKYNGIDRVDNDRGYTIDNCVTACFICNQAKHRQSKQSFENWIVRVYNNLKERLA